MRILKPLPGTLPMPEANLAGCWPMSSLGSKIFDVSGNGKHSTGTVGTAPTWQSGIFGPCLDFNNNGGISIPQLDDVYGANPRTISIWLNADSFDVNVGDAIEYFSNAGGGVAGEFYTILAEDNGISIGFNGHRPIWDKSNLVTGRFYNFVSVVPAGAVNTGDVLGYINGVLKIPTDEAGSSVALNTVADNATIGSYSAGSQYFDGKISSRTVWNRALSASEIARLYREPFYNYPGSRVFAA